MPYRTDKIFLAFVIACTCLFSCDNETGQKPEIKLQLSALRVGTYALDLNNTSNNTSAPTDMPIVGSFSSSLNVASTEQEITLKLKSADAAIPLVFSFLDNEKTFSAKPDEELISNEIYVLIISAQLKGSKGETFQGITIEFKTTPGTLEITAVTIAGSPAFNSHRITNVPVDDVSVQIMFAKAVDPTTINSQTVIVGGGNTSVPISISLSEQNTRLTIITLQKLKDFTRYQLAITDQVKGNNSEVMTTYFRDFYTTVDSAPDFPLISDDQLLTLIQQQTFKYFYDFAHPASGMARERNTSGNTVTSGGSGFGLMAIIVGIERNFITRQQGLDHLDKILNFLETADRFHGAWSHWIDGNTGNVQPFSANDNGGDLVETSFLIQGLITFRQYLNEADATEIALIERINTLWESVEWDWYTKGGEDVLYWHWSPDKEWTMNHQIRGYNEALITYVLAASSPSHSINASVYHQGWAKNGAIVNGKKFYDITLPLGEDYGGPLFFTHYSFLGLDPRNLNDTYASYWTQNVNHSLINHAYCVANPKNYAGYSDESWGLTASDNHQGYSAHSPTNDLGVISPTAALSSFPYTPEQSMKALKFFYYKFGDRLWGEYGFYDAYNPTEGWVAGSYLAIDQGPIVVMIENHRTGLLWELFMSAPEVQNGLNKLSFTY